MLSENDPPVAVLRSESATLISGLGCPTGAVGLLGKDGPSNSELGDIVEARSSASLPLVSNLKINEGPMHGDEDKCIVGMLSEEDRSVRELGMVMGVGRESQSPSSLLSDLGDLERPIRAGEEARIFGMCFWDPSELELDILGRMRAGENRRIRTGDWDTPRAFVLHSDHINKGAAKMKAISSKKRLLCTSPSPRCHSKSGM
mmetsp:Transcript_16118/g.32660  ORF Transcript_16118/g.32660 Transcript_16118/m.32660 type:complete len:202 (-) Transcript_16118:654-1259(-)